MRLTREFIKQCLPVRPKEAHKGSFGRVLIVAGSAHMAGAAVLCARSALQSGAGLVCLALPENRQCVAAAALPESLTLGLPQSKGVISAKATSVLKKFIAEFKPSVLLIGPGLSKAPFILPFLKSNHVPCVLDADALNALARNQKMLSGLGKKFPLICTPHPGEMQRLIGEKITTDSTLRIKQACRLSEVSRAVSVLKGFQTVITDGKTVYINPTGGPALAKGGSGDTLGGIIAGFWAQLGTAEGFNRLTALRAAAAGVYLHGLAADLAAKRLTDRCVLASDVSAFIPQAMKQILRAK